MRRLNRKPGAKHFFLKLKDEFLSLSKPSFFQWVKMTGVIVAASGIAAVVISITDLLITDVIRLFV